MGFGIGKVFKSVTKPFKSVAKKIKKVGGKIMGGIMKLPGFKQLGQLYNKTFGRLGPLGMIAASFILPGVGSLISQGWGAAAGALSGSSSGFLQAVGAGMKSISTGLSGIGTGISDKISGAFEKMGGGSITRGAQDMFQKASDWVTGGKSPSDFNLQAGSFLDPVAGPTPEFNLGTTLTEPGSLLGKAVQEGSFADPSSISLGLDTAGLAQPAPAFNIPEVAPGTVAKTSISESGAITVSNNAELGRGRGESFAKKALKAGATLLGGGIATPPATAFAAELPGINDDFGTQRFGIGGTGATGGQFLTPQQQLFFQQHAKLIGQQG